MTNTTYTRENAIQAIINYFEEHTEEFNDAIEMLDSYDGYLGDDRYFEMEMINEFYADTEPLELMNRIFYGHDEDNTWTDERGEKHYAEFNPNREWFTFNGYGNLVSSDYKDYSAHLDKWFAERLIEVSDIYEDEIPEEVKEIIESISDEE